MRGPETKPSRKPPEPRGLSVTLSVDVSGKLLQLGAAAGYKNKPEVEEQLRLWMEQHVGDFSQALAAEARARISELIASPEDEQAHGLALVEAAAKAGLLG